MFRCIYIFKKTTSSLLCIVGERANQIGPAALFRERLESADLRLLEDGNFSEVNTIEAIKKTASDHRNRYRLDEDIFRDCRVLAYGLRKADVESNDIEGKLIKYR